MFDSIPDESSHKEVPEMTKSARSDLYQIWLNVSVSKRNLNLQLFSENIRKDL